MSLPEEKKMARSAARKRRDAAFSSEVSEQISGHLAEFLSTYSCATLAGYLPIRSEVDPRPAMTRHSGPVCVPRVPGPAQPLEFLEWTPGCDLVEGAFGVMVPETERLVVPDVLIVPLLAFDAAGYRLGYGGGFYDRTLDVLRASGQVVAIGLAFAEQQTDKVPVEATDQPLDFIVTEHGLLATDPRDA